MTIDLNSIKTFVFSSFYQASEIGKEYYGKTFRLIKVGSNQLQPYMQDKRVAVVALIAFYLLSLQFAILFSRFKLKFFPNSHHSTKQNIAIAAGLTSYCASGFLITRYGPFPLSWQVSSVTAVAVFLFQMMIEKDPNQSKKS